MLEKILNILPIAVVGLAAVGILIRNKVFDRYDEGWLDGYAAALKEIHDEGSVPV